MTIYIALRRHDSGQAFQQNATQPFFRNQCPHSAAVDSVMDIWLPLSMGCGIVIPTSDDIKDPDRMRSLIAQHRIVFLMIVPSHLQVSLQRLLASASIEPAPAVKFGTACEQLFTHLDRTLCNISSFHIHIDMRHV